MNTVCWRDMQNKNSTTYDEVVEVIGIEIVNEEMIDHRNNVAQGFRHPRGKWEKDPRRNWLASNGPKLDTPWLLLQDKLW